MLIIPVKSGVLRFGPIPDGDLSRLPGSQNLSVSNPGPLRPTPIGQTASTPESAHQPNFNLNNQQNSQGKQLAL